MSTATIDPLASAPPVTPVVPPAAAVEKPADAAPAAKAETTPAAAADKPADKTPETPKSLLADAPAADAPKAEDKPADPPKDEKPPEEDLAAALKLPEGSKLEAATVKEVADFAKANKLTKEVAQAVLDQRHALAVKQEAQLKAAYNKLYDTFVADLKADKDFGGEKFQANVDLAKRAVKQIFTVEERAALESSPFGNHPILVKAMARLGARLAEDGNFTAGGSPPRAKEFNPAVDMFPSLKAKQ